MLRKVALALLPFLFGCAATSVKEMKSDPANAVHTTIEQNYQRVYKNLLGRMQECMSEGPVGMFAQYHVRHVLLPELREATISYAMSNMGTQNYYLHVDISGVSENQTKLDTYIFFSTWRHVLPKIQAWATNPDAPCDVQAPPPT